MNMFTRLKQIMSRKKIDAKIKADKLHEKASTSTGQPARRIARDAHRSITYHDVRLKSLCGMNIQSIRRCYGLNAARYVARIYKAQDEIKEQKKIRQQRIEQYGRAISQRKAMAS